MNAAEDADGTLVLSYDSVSLSKVMIAAALLFAGTAAYDLSIGSRGDDRLVGLAGATITCLLIGLVFLERSQFAFNPSTRTIRWQRQWAWNVRSGELRFDDVAGVLVEVPIGDQGIPSRRITLKLVDGSAVPLTVGYSPDHGDAMLHLRDRIRVVLWPPSGEMPARVI